MITPHRKAYQNDNYMIHNELWKDVVGFEGAYKVSSFGRVKSLRGLKGGFLKPLKNTDGYLMVVLFSGGKRECHRIHRLVATHFIVNPDDKETVNHIDGDKENNRLDNLEWATRSEQALHMFRIGLKSHKGENHPRRRLNNEQVLEVFNSKEAAKLLSDKYNVSRDTISSIRKGYIWSHLTGKKYTVKKRPRPDQIIAIFNHPKSQSNIAKETGFSKAFVNLVKTGKVYSEITGKYYVRK